MGCVFPIVHAPARSGAVSFLQASKVLDKLEIVKEGDTLKVRRKNGSFSWGIGDRGAKIYVTMPRMVAASATSTASAVGSFD